MVLQLVYNKATQTDGLEGMVGGVVVGVVEGQAEIPTRTLVELATAAVIEDVCASFSNIGNSVFNGLMQTEDLADRSIEIVLEKSAKIGKAVEMVLEKSANIGKAILCGALRTEDLADDFVDRLFKRFGI